MACYVLKSTEFSERRKRGAAASVQNHIWDSCTFSVAVRSEFSCRLSFSLGSRNPSLYSTLAWELTPQQLCHLMSSWTNLAFLFF